MGKGQLGLVVEYNAISNFDLWSEFPQRPHVYLVTPSANVAITLPEIGNADNQATAGHRIIIKNLATSYIISVQKFDTTPVKLLENSQASMFVAKSDGNWEIVDTENDKIECDSFGNLILPETMNLTGTQNVGYGCDTFAGMLNGNNNVAVGYESSNVMINASDNTAIGHSTLQSCISGTGNICVGKSADVANPNSTNITVIGNNLTGSIDGAVYLNLAIPDNSVGEVLKYNPATGQVGPDSSAIIPACDANNNIFVGSMPTTTGTDNAGLGCGALGSLTTGFRNTAVGRSALALNSSGDQNTAIGFQSLTNNVSGTGNTAIGVDAMADNITGSNNVGVGWGSLKSSNSIENTAFGHSTLFNLTTGLRNVAVGYESALNSNATDNVSIGHRSLLSNTTGIRNIAVGNNAMSDNVAGNDNTVMGHDAMRMGIIGSSNVSIGRNSLFANVTGSGNVAVGTSTGFTIEGGVNNILVGQSADASQFADHITVIGAGVSGTVDRGLYFNTGLATTSGDVMVYDTLTGQAGPDPTISVPINDTNNNLFAGANPDATGSNNTGYGDEALASLTTGNNNSGFGANALTNVSSGNCNTAVGYNSGLNITIGTGNTALGCSALDTPTIGNLNIAIGDMADVVDGVDNVTVIGTGITGSITRGLYFNTGLADNTGEIVVYDPATGQMGPDPSLTASSTDANDNLFTGSSPNATGSNNTGYGDNALASLTTGNSNSAFGADALSNLTSGSCNHGYGHNALLNLTTGNNNIGIGCNALDSVITGSNNIGIGLNVDVPADATHITILGIDVVGSVNRGLYFNTGLADVTTGEIARYDPATGQMGPDPSITASTTDANDNLFTGSNPNATGSNNTGYGDNALASLTTGNSNSAFGADALSNLTSGSCNHGYGHNSLLNLTIGNQNVALGCNSLDSVITGSDNVGIGHNVDALADADHVTVIGSGITGTLDRGLYFNTGLANITSGSIVKYDSTTGQMGPDPTASLIECDASNNLFAEIPSGITTANANTGYGCATLSALTSGINNTAVGRNAGSTITIGDNNICVGFGADAVSNAQDITVIGNNVTGSVSGGLYFNSSLTQVTSGNYVRYDSSSGQMGPDPAPIGLVSDANDNLIADENPSVTGINNTGIGAGALAVLTTGNNNSAFGKDALNANTSGISNTAMGTFALNSNTTGVNNTAIGVDALNSNTVGNHNVAVGRSSLLNNTTGSANVAIGVGAMDFNTTGIDNTAVGYGSLGNMTAGINNTTLGFRAGDAITTGNDNIIIGHEADASGTADNIVVIGSGIVGTINRGLYFNTGLADVTSGSVIRYDPLTGQMGPDPSVPTSPSGASCDANNNLFIDGPTGVTGSDNSGFGCGALANLTTGTDNTVIGRSSGSGITTDINNICIGSSANSTGSNITVIGNSITGSVANGLYFNTALAQVITGSVVRYDASSGQMGPDPSVPTSPSGGSIVCDANNNLFAETPSGFLTGQFNTSFGCGALASLTSAQQNVAIGYNALNALTTTQNNIAIGTSAMSSSNAGVQDNVAIGINSLGALVNTGANNVAVGHNSNSVDGSSRNTIIGDSAVGNGDDNVLLGYSTNSNGSNECVLVGANAESQSIGSTYIGYFAGNQSSSTTGYNIGIGHRSVGGSVNVFNVDTISIGRSTLSAGTTSTNNIALGNFALQSFTGGCADNIAIGHNSMNSHTGNRTIGIGSGVSVGNNSDGIAIGHNSVITTLGAVAIGSGAYSINSTNIGYQAGDANTSDDVNIGYQANTSNSGTSGSRNIAIGYRSMHERPGVQSVGIGYETLFTNGETENVAVGYFAMRNCGTGGEGNVAIGHNAVAGGPFTGDNNVIIGKNSSISATTARNNVIIGSNTASLLTNGFENVIIGLNAGITASGNGMTIIGPNASGNVDNGLFFRAGLTNLTTGSVVKYDTSTGQMGPDPTFTGGNLVCDVNNNLFAEIPPSLTTGTNNTSFGCGAMLNLSSGFGNTAIGSNSLENIVSTTGNTAVGYNIFSGNVFNGNANTLIGSESMRSLGMDVISGANTTLGFETMRINSTFTPPSAVTLAQNIAIGIRALEIDSYATFVTDNIAIGTQALSITNFIRPDKNIAIGFNAMAGIGGTNFLSNIGIGTDALKFAAGESDNNICIGNGAGYGLPGVSLNNIIMTTSTIVTSNVGGPSIDESVYIGHGNTTVNGISGTLRCASVGALNRVINCQDCAIYGSLHTMQSGVENVAIGFASVISNGIQGSITLGSQVSCSASFSTAIGYQANATVISGLFFNPGMATVSSVAVHYNTATGQMGPISSSRTKKTNIVNSIIDYSKVLELKPVDFNWIDVNDGKRDFGLIAEDVNTVLPEIVPKDSNNNPIAVNYEKLGLLLIPVVRNLSEKCKLLEEQNSAKDAKIAQLENQIANILERLNNGGL